MCQERSKLYTLRQHTTPVVTVHDSEARKLGKYRRLIGVPRNFARGNWKSSPLEWMKRLDLSTVERSWTGAGRPLERIWLSSRDLSEPREIVLRYGIPAYIEALSMRHSRLKALDKPPRI